MTTPGITLDAPWNGQEFSPPVPLGLGAVERALVDHLKDMAARYGGPLSQVGIDHFPDRPEAYRNLNQGGLILVAFGEASYTPAPMAVDEVLAERAVSWDFQVIARDLGWSYGGQASGTSPGAYAIMDSLRLALVGLQIPGFTKMTLVHERFTRRDPDGAGVWYYETRYQHRTMMVQCDPDVAYPLWKQLTWREVGGITVEAMPAAPYVFDAGARIALPHGNVSVVVVANPDTNEVYDEEQYLVDHARGVLTAVLDGSLGPGVSVLVSYRTGDIVVVPVEN